MDIQTAIKDEKFLKRFWSKVTKIQDGCWIWTGSQTVGGYGSIRLPSPLTQKIMAHRASYLIATGQEIDGLEVCHHCDNPSCVNPQHLWAGTHKENMNDSKNKGRLDAFMYAKTKHLRFDVGSVHRNLTHCKRGHPFDDKNTGKQANGRYCKRCEADRKQKKRAREKLG